MFGFYSLYDSVIQLEGLLTGGRPEVFLQRTIGLGLAPTAFLAWRIRLLSFLGEVL